MMKDKLKKSGHTKAYYKMQRLLFFFLIGATITSIAAIPVGISYKIAAYAEESEHASSSLSEMNNEEEEKENSSETIYKQ